ncbi:MAG: invasion associated locus family protein [Micavibrio sp.]|nr:invasion associated locus family protein [Micavibrio sp.]
MFSIRKFTLLSLLFAAFYAHPATAADAKAAAAPSTAQKTELWSKRCQDIKNKDEKTSTKYCEVFQRLSSQSKDGKTFQRVAEFAVGYPPGKKEASAVIVLPLGILVQETMSIFVDDKNENHFHVQYCLPDGCYATLNLSDKLLETIGKGKALKIAGKAMTGQPLHIIMDLTGFDKAMAAIR